MILLAALFLSLAGFTGLGLAMEHHHRKLWNRPPHRTQAAAQRLAGSLALTASAALAVHDRGWGIGLAAWICLMPVAGVAFTLLLTFSPARSPAATGRSTTRSPAPPEPSAPARRRSGAGRGSGR